MRGTDHEQGGMFSYVSLEARVPESHPLRPLRALADRALSGLDQDFEALYGRSGRNSVAPERLLRASLLQILYSIRSERMLVEQLDYNLLFRWFVGLTVDEPVWDHSTFSRNRERLLRGDIARKFFEAVLEQARAAGLTSDEHFRVDGTLVGRTRASGAATARMTTILTARAATPGATSTASGARTTPMPRPPTPRRGCTARASPIRRDCASRGMR